MFQIENALPFIHGAKESEWNGSSWLAIYGDTVFLSVGNPYKALQYTW